MHNARCFCLLMSAALLCISSGLAQSLSADSFLNDVAAHPVSDEAQQNQSAEVYMALNNAPPAEVERVIPAVLHYARVGNEIHVRRIAILFLSSIAIRPDGAALLYSRSNEISSLLTDEDPGIQKVAVGIADWVIAKSAPNNQPYLSAFKEVLQRPQTDQGVVMVGMIGPLFVCDSSDPDALKSVLAFLRRDDLTRSTRTQLVHELGVEPGLPEKVNQYLVERLDDPDPWVRAAAVASFADSTTEYHALAKDRVQRMAKDSQENPQVRELAKEAIAGKTHLDPNIYPPPDKPNDH